MEDASRHAKETGRVTMPSPRSAGHAEGDDDLISALDDDVLLRILESVAEAGMGDVVRTGALSQRWRGLWARVPALRFASWPEFKSAAAVERFIAIVDGVLALRARSTDAGVRHLEISLRAYRARDEEQLVLQSVGAAERWIRHAVQHGVASLFLRLRLPPKECQDDDDDGWDDYDDDGNERPVMALDELPGSAKLETMHLALAGARLRLPATVTLESLVDLTLQWISVAAGSEDLLARLLSPACCPRLQKLCMWNIGGLRTLSLDAGELLELSLDHIAELEKLELRTPKLQVLQIEFCMHLKVLMVSAPRLEELSFLDNPSNVYFHGDLPCVRSLKFEILSHGALDDDGFDGTTVSLLKRCTSARDLVVVLDVPPREDRRFELIKHGMPQLPHVTSLAVHVYEDELHSVGDGVAGLLTRFKNLIYLSIQSVNDDVNQSVNDDVKKQDFICDHPDHWKSNDISLAHLQEAEFIGFAGTECELRFLQFVLASAKDLRKLVVRFNVEYSLVGRRENVERMLLEGGTWATCCDGNESYEWRLGSCSQE
ncbi:hypothetical protein ACP70R_024220 [Stipagrostis hirtigluma subsp. patula]